MHCCCTALLTSSLSLLLGVDARAVIMRRGSMGLLQQGRAAAAGRRACALLPVHAASLVLALKSIVVFGLVGLCISQGKVAGLLQQYGGRGPVAISKGKGITGAS
jgi:hypothetical protein